MRRDGALTWIFLLATLSVVDGQFASLANEIPGLTWGFSQWGGWSGCSCETDTRTRSRSCRNLRACEGPWRESIPCRAWGCHVNGNWGEWSAYVCQATCGFSVQVRSRRCDSPPPAARGVPCVGPTTEVSACPNLPPCNAIHGGWAQWGAWGACDASCGGGRRFRSRDCSAPTPKNGGRKCQGPWQGVDDCNMHECAADPDWTVWGAWSVCDVTCGAGIQERSRSCIVKEEVNRGKTCPGRPTEQMACSLKACPVDGRFTQWSSWSGCSSTCGSSATRSRTRTCGAPAPKHGGRTCSGDTRQMSLCTGLPACTEKIDGNWGLWGAWQSGVTCGVGSRIRERYCNSPPPTNGGRQCLGSGVQSGSYDHGPCPEAGSWGEWGWYSSCSATCGQGTNERTRSCDSPPPKHGGAQCEGRGREVKACQADEDCLDTEWSQWSPWVAMSTCGSSVQSRTRTCPKQGLCAGSHTEARDVTLGICPVHGGYGPWTAWACPVTCGGGRGYRSRVCDSPRPKHGGRMCVGGATEYNTCGREACPVSGTWSEWSSWGYCNRKSCRSSRKRICKGGNFCDGAGVESKSCKCIVDGNWGSWGSWSTCSKSCEGTSFRHRKCNNPAPSYYGRRCVGYANQWTWCNRCKEDDKNFG